MTYDRRELLRRCLDSLLRQDYPASALEIVVSDDGSTDGTAEMVRELAARHPQIVYAPQPHRGIPANRNNGLRHARGAIVAFVADDYVMRPDYVTTCVRFLRENPDADVIRFRVVPADDHFGARVSHCFYDVSIRKRLLLGASIERQGALARIASVLRRLPDPPDRVTADHALEAAGAAAFRRSVFERVGLFDERLKRTEDTDFTVRLRAAGIPVYYDPRHTVGTTFRRLPLDTIRKCFLTGVHRAQLARKLAAERKAGRDPLGTGVRAKASGLLDAVLRARQAGSAPRFIAYLPIFLLFEAADATGYAFGRLWKTSDDQEVAGRLG